jgi:hypothetical protein
MKSQPAKNDRRSTTKVAERFERFDGVRFAIVMPQVRREPFRGVARYERDDLLGNVLRIAVDGKSPGNPEILLTEDDWQGLITPDAKYGCDYCVVLLPDGT